MDAPQDYESLKRRLIEVEPALPKRLRQAAAFALDHPDEVALGTAARIAARAEVQASTLVRFAQALGFAGFSDLQALFRAHLRNRWPDYSERLEALHHGALASGDPLRLLFGFADSAAASLAKLRSSAAARGAGRGARPARPGAADLRRRSAALVQRRPLSGLRARPARSRRGADRRRRRPRARAARGGGQGRRADRDQLCALRAVHPRTGQGGARRGHAGRRRHRQRIEPARWARRGAARSGGERFRLVPLVGGDLLPGDDSGRRGRRAARAKRTETPTPPPARGPGRRPRRARR